MIGVVIMFALRLAIARHGLDVVTKATVKSYVTPVKSSPQFRMLFALNILKNLIFKLLVVL